MLVAPRRALLALVLVALTLLSGACSNRFSKRMPGDAPDSGLQATAPSGALQEVAPPGAVQQLNERLNERAPQVRVLAPADDALLPAGPWTLKLQVRDWPLSDAGSLGPGPHLVVQLDDQEPQRVTGVEAAASLPMPALTPGSHRVTVYAARPWGEAVKAPGASTQIRVHRVARNAAQLPVGGSAQLIAASPDGLQQEEPVLIDWLLLDAPLQNLRSDDARWRLRVSVNGDSFLVDRQTPLWLKGFRRGSNAVQLELLDGRGDPLNPPFNSLVREVVIGGERAAWLRPSLPTAELALLSGETPAEAEPMEPDPEPVTETNPAGSSESAESSPLEDGETAAEPDPMPEPTTEVQPEPETDVELSAQEPMAEAEEEPEQTAPIAAEPMDRVTPQTRLSGSARDQVNADGQLQQPPARGPLAGLREKLGG